MLASVRALSSAGERSLHTGEVIGSIPIAPTILARISRAFSFPISSLTTFQNGTKREDDASTRGESVVPVWSVVIALCLLIAYAVKLAAIGGNEHLRQYNIGTFPIIRLTQVVGLAAIDRAVFLKTTPLAEAPTFRRGRRHRQLLSVRQVLCRLRCCIVCRS